MDRNKPLQKENNNIAINAATKVGLTFGQLFSILALAFTMTMGYASINSRITALEKSFSAHKDEFRAVMYKQNAINESVSSGVSAIKESLIRIEERLETKKDKW